MWPGEMDYFYAAYPMTVKGKKYPDNKNIFDDKLKSEFNKGNTKVEFGNTDQGQVRYVLFRDKNFKNKKMDKFNLKKFLSEKSLLNENAPGYDTRKTGEALPTLESVKAAYEAKQDKEEVKEGVWSVLPDRIPEFIQKIEDIKDEYHAVVGSDSVYDGLDMAIRSAEELLNMELREE